MKTIENKPFKDDETVEMFHSKIKNLSNENELLKHELEEKDAKIKAYEEQIRLLTHQKFSSSKDQVAEGQLSLFNEVEKESTKQASEPELEEITYQRRTGRSKSRKKYQDLEVEEIIYDLSDEEKVCPKCNSELHHMKYDIRKEFKYIPATLKIVHHKKQVCACRYCDTHGQEGTIVSAQAPNPVLPGSLVSPSFLAILMDMKYNKMLPLYRQEKAFEEIGVDISRQNMASWVIKGSEKYLKPIFDRLHFYLLKEDIIQADETVLNVLDEKDNKNNYMWLYASSERGRQQIYLYDYQKSRAGKHAKAFLEGFTGYLQTDGYAAYDKIQNTRSVGCLAHARRKFTDALKALPEDADLSATKINQGLQFFSQIYDLEKDFKILDDQTRFEKRIQSTKPILDSFYDWLLVEEARTLPKSLLGKAIKYTLKQWDKLIVFLEDGRLSADNNRSERAIKPFVIGRKNFLFSKSPKGATASGMVYSIIETAKANNLIPFKYLTYLFEKLPNIDLEDYEELDACLPWSEKLPKDLRPKTESSED
jgi:transposase